MKALEKLAREYISANHIVFDLYYPRGVQVQSRYGGGGSIAIRTGKSASSRALMKAAILEMGAMKNGGHRA